ncbi:MAG: HEAT repeat domain-containing protein [Aphanothece saxicola GSE-SYN-MK-01-06B]|jgi:phycocyanobilin lyase beta subunit|nr:HEAT repeat domain-containing protein [Aphanothece saxicola GSE-SYN-MK-01-06B]
MTAASGDSRLAADRIRAFEQAGSAEELVAATRRLIACDDPLATVPHLVQVLGFNNPGAAVAAVDGLIALGPAAVGPLLANLDAHNYGARAWAVRALAGIGDPRGLDVLEDALATDVGPSVRRAAARGLGALRLEALTEEERRQMRERCLGALESGRGDGEWVVRYAVAVGLEGLALPLPPAHPHSHRAEACLQQLQDPEREDTLVVRLRAGVALKRLNAR